MAFNRRSLSHVNYKKLGIAALSVLAVIIAIRAINNTKAESSPVANEPVVVAEPLNTTVVNQSFAFPLNDENGTAVSQIQYTIESAELRDEIIVKGQRAKAVEGRVFLILNLKVRNDYQQGVQINTKDYVRLVLDGTNEQLAPAIHNDPVTVQAISTKPTRVGFTLDAGQKSFLFKVGEISGDKQDVPVNFN